LKCLIVAASALAVLTVVPSGSAHAQDQEYLSGPLSLDQAIQFARIYNPTFRAAENNAVVADWDVKSAYGSLFPSANASGGLSYQAEDTGGQGRTTAPTIPCR
jgi:outer membrane protein TolC